MNKAYFIFLPLVLFSSEFVMIDDTEEGKRKAKENAVAPDGKIIYKPMEVDIVKPIMSNVINSMKPNIIYPIGVNAPLEESKKKELNISKQVENNKTSEMDDVFASINSDKNNSKAENIVAGEDVEIKESVHKNRALDLEMKE